VNYECCLHCRKRRPACHDSCPEYLEGKQAQRDTKEKISRAKMADKLKRDYIHEHYGKEKKR